MLEKDIENLIAKYPNEFFPDENLTLISQQYTVQGKRIDILLEDKYKRKIIVEVKRGILTREASGQIIEYYGLLKNENQDSIYEMVLCANIIPNERKLALENIGIECKELGLAFISEVAQKYNYIFTDEVKSINNYSIESPATVSSNVISKNLIDDKIPVWIFQGNVNP